MCAYADCSCTFNTNINQCTTDTLCIVVTSNVWRQSLHNNQPKLEPIIILMPYRRPFILVKIVRICAYADWAVPSIETSYNATINFEGMQWKQSTRARCSEDATNSVGIIYFRHNTINTSCRVGCNSSSMQCIYLLLCSSEGYGWEKNWHLTIAFNHAHMLREESGGGVIFVVVVVVVVHSLSLD